jgi:hypothetical protein
MGASPTAPNRRSERPNGETNDAGAGHRLALRLSLMASVFPGVEIRQIPPK